MSVSLTYGNPNTGIVLVQPVDDHDMSVMDSEVRYIRELTDQEFGLIAVKVRNWNNDLSPWVAPAAFGNEGFGNGAAWMEYAITWLVIPMPLTSYRQ